MLLNIAFAALLMVMTTAIHAGGMILAMRAIRSKMGPVRPRLQQTPIYRVGGVVVLMFLVSVLEVWV